MCFSIPASFIHPSSSLCTRAYEKPLKTCPLSGLPQSSSASSVIGSEASVSVFSVVIRRQWPPSGYAVILSQVRSRMSPKRRPVRQLKRDARLRTSDMHGVSASFCNSSSVRYCLWVSTVSMDSR